MLLPRICNPGPAGVALRTMTARYGKKSCPVPGKLKAILYPPNSRGANSATEWAYNELGMNDCYDTAEPCPEGQYCQVSWRETFFPFSRSPINRGRCVPYVSEGGQCTGDYFPSDSLDAVFPSSEFVGWLEPPLLCAQGLACAKNIKVLHGPVCVRARSVEEQCQSTWPSCAGRTPPVPLPDGSGLDWASWRQKQECYGSENCLTAKQGGGLSREKLEYCAQTSVLTMLGDQDPVADFQRNSTHLKARRARIAAIANGFLQQLWPYPVCEPGSNGSDCTIFPLQPIYELTPGEYWPFEYHCQWGVLHMTSENGPEALTEVQSKAFVSMVNLYRMELNCKICRTNFDKLVEYFGLPDRRDSRSAWADWFWLAHNNANEHTYATHSVKGVMMPRVSDWANPVYENAWFLTRDMAKKTWRI